MRGSLRVCGAVITLLCCLAVATAQISVQGGSPPKGGSPSNSQTQYRSQVNLEFHMTPEEATRLLSSVDEVIESDSKITGLPVSEHVERKITNREELKKLLEERMRKPEVAQSVQRSAAVLKKFGFIPRDFDLRQFSTEAVVNELAGYYDPAAKTMYLLNWLPATAQLPVLAHELDHALQDQNFHLAEWFKTDDPAANGPTGGDASEQKAARHAAAEGHATAVMMEYLLSQRGRSLAQMPELSPEMVQTISDRFLTLPTTQKIPPILREDMVFPYLYGLMFVHEILLKAGKEEAYTGIFKHPPESTRQILEPATYLAHERLAPLPMPPLEAILEGHYDKIENGSIGEFDCLVFMKQFGSLEEAKEISKSWRGDYFYAASRAREGGKEGAQSGTGVGREPDVSLLFVSRWANPSAARRFAGFYRATVPQRYSGAKPSGSPEAQVVSDIENWETSEGKVRVHAEGNLVIAIESFDEQSALRINDAVLKEDKK